MPTAGWRVCFSDFNREVLEHVTIPNVRLNVEERYWSLAEYFSGDWDSLSPLLKEVMKVDCCRLSRRAQGTELSTWHIQSTRFYLAATLFFLPPLPHQIILAVSS